MILSAPEIIRRLNKDCTQEHLVITPYSRDCQQPVPMICVLPAISFFLKAYAHLFQLLNGLNFQKTLPEHSAAGHPSEGGEYLLGAGFVDPGFRGQLTLCLTNMGCDDLIVQKNDRVVQMILHEVREGNECYSGRYQDSRGAVEAR